MALGTSPGTNRTVLVISGDQVFLDGTARFLKDHRVLAARNVTDAQRRIVEDSVDLAIFDPSFATDAGVSDGGQLLQVDPDLPLVLVADTLEIRVHAGPIRKTVKWTRVAAAGNGSSDEP